MDTPIFDRLNAQRGTFPLLQTPAAAHRKPGPVEAFFRSLFNA